MFATAVTTLVVSVLVLRQLDYTLEAMATLSLLPSFQAFVLCWLARGSSPHRPLPELVTLAWYRSARAAWGLAALALGAWVLVYRGVILPDADPRALVTLGSGVILGAAGVAFTVGSRRRTDKMGSRGLVLFAVVCGSLALLCIAVGFGFRLTALPPFGVVKAVVWGLVAAALVPALLRAAPALRPGPALLLETSAVLAAASMSAIPLLLYLRPYFGAAWLDPCRFALLAGSVLILTASLHTTEPPPVPEASLSPVKPSLNLRGCIALWLTLQGSYLIGWFGLGLALGGAPNLSNGAYLYAALIPVVQFLTISMYQILRSRRRRIV